MNYPNAEDTIEILIQAARRAAAETRARHPEDIAIAMSMAIETAGLVVMDSFKKFHNVPDV